MIRLAAILGFLLVASALPSFAEDGNAAKFLVINAGDSSDGQWITVGDIEALGTETVHAFNPYEKLNEDFTGVWMKDFVAHFGPADASSLTIRAIDDYQITFKKEEWLGTRILLVTRVNGDYIDFDQKGPVRVIYPDYDESLASYQVNLPKWIWMITEFSME
ncbi:molybdopterin-dependent oxidoreductase [Roseibium sp. M-1]